MLALGERERKQFRRHLDDNKDHTLDVEAVVSDIYIGGDGIAFYDGYRRRLLLEGEVSTAGNTTLQVTVRQRGDGLEVRACCVYDELEGVRFHC